MLIEQRTFRQIVAMVDLTINDAETLCDSSDDFDVVEHEHSLPDRTRDSSPKVIHEDELLIKTHQLTHPRQNGMVLYQQSLAMINASPPFDSVLGKTMPILFET